MRILLTGATGQVGLALQETLSRVGELFALSRSQLDIVNPSSVREAVRATRPDVLVNAAAYTAVDQAEGDEPHAFAVNRDGPRLLAEEAKKRNALFVHFSTDYVFDGRKASPYTEADTPNPLNVYGRSKLAGEEAILGSGCRHLIFRTSWVYSLHGNNFLLTILRLARERKKLRIVDDQHGAPTSAHMIALAVSDAISRVEKEEAPFGLYHMTAAGSTTWYGFACAIANGDIERISSAEYPSPARRPKNSLLDNSKLLRELGIRLPHWEVGLKETLRK